MFIKSKIFRIVSLSAIVIVLTAFAFADTIRLKNGSIIKGKIVSFGRGQFVIVVGDGARQRNLSYFADEIESIQFDSGSNPAEMINTSADRTDVTTKKPAYTKTSDGNNTVITIGSAPPNTNPKAKSAPNDGDVPEPKYTPPADTAVKAQPIRISAKVLADNTANGWTNSGWVVRKGQKIRIMANGRISLGNGRYSAPTGISTLPDAQKLIKNEPTGGLIVVIGDDNNDFIFVGADREFIAERDGALFLGINEGVLADNSGSFNVTIEIDPNIVK